MGIFLTSDMVGMSVSNYLIENYLFASHTQAGFRGRKWSSACEKLTESARRLTHLKSPQYLVRFTRVLEFFASFIMVRDILEMAIAMHLWSETKPAEHRSACWHSEAYAPANRPTEAPSTAKSLLEARPKVSIERSTV
jgi:hypothetical protein